MDKKIKTLYKNNVEFNPKSVAKATLYNKSYRDYLCRNEKETLDIIFDELTMDSISRRYVDLGLPSGKLWCSSNMGTMANNAIGDLYQAAQLLPSTYAHNYTTAHPYKTFNEVSIENVENRYEGGGNSIGGSQEPTRTSPSSIPSIIKTTSTRANAQNRYLYLVPYGRGYILKKTENSDITSTTIWSTINILDQNGVTMTPTNLKVGSDIQGITNTSIANNGNITNFIRVFCNNMDSVIYLYWDKNDNKWSLNLSTDFFNDAHYTLMYYEVDSPDVPLEGMPLVTNGLLKDEYDIAYATYDGDARIPTISEVNELLDNTTFTYIESSHIVKLQSKHNGNYILLPCNYVYNYGYNHCSLFWIKEGSWVTDSPNNCYTQSTYLELVFDDNRRIEPYIQVITRRDDFSRRMVCPIRAIYTNTDNGVKEREYAKERILDLFSKTRYLEELCDNLINEINNAEDYIIDNNKKDVVCTMNLSWTDGNRNNVDRSHLFVTPPISDGSVSVVATTSANYYGVSGKGSDGSSVKVYFRGVVVVRDSGDCVVGERCSSTNQGKATYNENGKFLVVDRINSDYVKVLLK